jgi:hypothetical protein
MTVGRYALLGLLFLPAPLSAQKSSGSQPQEIFYRAPYGKGTQLVATARDGTNLSRIYEDSGSLYFGFDVGSADSGVIIIGSRTGELRLVQYARNSSGVFGRTNVTTLLSGISLGSPVDLSPDGNRIAYRAATGGALMVYNLTDRSNTEWLRGPYAWDFVWARDGESLVVLDQSSQPDRRSRLYELRSPGQAIEILNHRRLDAVEVSRLKSDELLLSYNSDDGSAHVGTWRMPIASSDGATSPGEWIVPSLAGRNAAFRGVFSCDDKYLIYGGSGPSGQQIWLTKTLPSGADVAISKAAANAIPQSWSRCATPPASSGSALEFREVP